ncbi:MAG: DUF2997 domain-containing protein [Clostridiales bacterium]|nr:DUF2997 domain-containing protein [Clostridiales bacterium]
MEQRIKATIGIDGNVEIETLEGFQGSACAKETEKLLQAIGGTVVEEKKKASFYEDGDNPVEILNQ